MKTIVSLLGHVNADIGQSVRLASASRDAHQWRVTTLRIEPTEDADSNVMTTIEWEFVDEEPHEGLMIEKPASLSIDDVGHCIGEAVLSAQRHALDLLQHQTIAFLSMVHWMRTIQETEAHALARDALSMLEKNDSTAIRIAVNEEAVSLLSREVISRVRAFIDAVPTSIDCEASTWNEALAEAIEPIDNDASKRIRHKANTWKPWLLSYRLRRPFQRPFLRASKQLIEWTGLLWSAVVQPRIKERNRKPDALTNVVHVNCTYLMRRTQLETDPDGQLSIPTPGHGRIRISPSIDRQTLDAILLMKGVKEFGSITSQRVFRDLVVAGHRQARERYPYPTHYWIEGGWSKYAERLGMVKKYGRVVQAIIEAWHTTEIPLPGGASTRMITRTFWPARGQRKGKILLEIGHCLLPNFVHELKEKGVRGLELGLVPMLPIPPLVGLAHTAHHGPLTTYSMMIVGYMREHARTIVEQGALPLPRSVVNHLADESMVVRDLATKAIEHWQSNHDDGPAMFAKTPNGYMLGPTYQNEWSLIVKGGTREIQGAKWGRKGVERKRRKLLKQ